MKRIYTFETQIQVVAFSNFSVVSISTEFSELCVKPYGRYCGTGEINMIIFSWMNYNLAKTCTYAPTL